MEFQFLSTHNRAIHAVDKECVIIFMAVDFAPPHSYFPISVLCFILFGLFSAAYDPLPIPGRLARCSILAQRSSSQHELTGQRAPMSQLARQQERVRIHSDIIHSLSPCSDPTAAGINAL